MAPTVKNSGQIGEYDGSSGSSVTFNIANCVVNDIIVLFQGIDWTWPVEAIPTPTGTGITWTARTTQTPSVRDAGFNVVYTGVVTSAGTRSVTVSSGSRDASANANWYHLNDEWTFHAASTTNVQTSTTYNSPSIASCEDGDHYFAAWQSEYQNATDWGLPGSFIGGLHANGGDGVQSSGYEELTVNGSSGTRTATRGGTAVEWCATAIVMRPLVTSLDIFPSGIASAEAHGTTTVQRGSVTVSNTGIPSAEAHGQPTLTTTVTVTLTGIPSAEAFGETKATGGLIPIGVASEEAFGTPELHNLGVGPTGIPSAEAFGGTVFLVGAILIDVGTGIPSEQGVGDPSVFNYGLGPTSIPTEEGMGAPSLSVGEVYINPPSIDSGEAFGSVAIHNYGLGPSGIPSEEAFGILYAFQLVNSVGSIPTEEAFGTAQLNLTIYPNGIESEEIFGSTAGDVPEMPVRQIAARLITRYDLVCVARIPRATGAPSYFELDPIEWSTLRYSEELNKPMTLSAKCKINNLTDVVVQRIRAGEELPTELWLYRNGQKIFAGPMLGGQVNGEDISLEAQDLSAYFRYMGVESDLVFTQTDQFQIAKGLVDHFQNLEYGHYGIDTSSILSSGVLRDISYIAKEQHLVAQRLEELATGENGFDFSVDPVTRALILYYPQRGSNRAEGEDSIVFDDRNVTSPDITFSMAPGDVATQAIGTSNNSGNETFISMKENSELRSKFGRAVVFGTFNVADQDGLDSKTQGLLNVRDRALFIPGPKVRVTPDSDLSQYGVGDIVSYSLEQRLGVIGTFRLLSRNVDVASTGKETVDFQFV